MKIYKVFAGVLGGMAILIASSALAADKASIKLYDPTLVNGTQLAAGDYEVQWDGTGSDVQLKIMRGKKVVASTPASIVQLKTPAPQSMTSTRGGDHDRTLTGISLRGKNYAFAVGNGSAQKNETDVAKK